MVCSDCGAAVAPAQRFCGECGLQITEESQPRHDSPQEPAAVDPQTAALTNPKKEAKPLPTTAQYVHFTGRVVIVGGLLLSSWWVLVVGLVLCSFGGGPWIRKAEASVMAGAVAFLITISVSPFGPFSFISVCIIIGTMTVVDELVHLEHPAWFGIQ